jgi:hypothetical protein
MPRETTFEEVITFVKKHKFSLENSCFLDNYSSYDKLLVYLTWNMHKENTVSPTNNIDS